MTKYSYDYRIQFIDKSYCTGNTLLGLGEFHNWINQHKKDFIILADNIIINRRNISIIEIKEKIEFPDEKKEKVS